MREEGKGEGLWRIPHQPAHWEEGMEPQEVLTLYSGEEPGLSCSWVVTWDSIRETGVC